MSNFNSAISQVQRREYIIGSIDAQGNFSISAKPATHANLSLASAEATRLARLNPGKVFVPMQLAGGVVAAAISTF